MKSLFIILFILLTFASNANAASIIRDTEIEVTIRLIANPILKAAGLNPKDVNIYIVNDKNINAYVSGGSNIFIHTGLLSLSKDPNMLVGVIAHETGHIVGRHLFKGAERAKYSAVKSTVGYMLGLAAAAAGAPQAGAAIVSGAQQVVQRQALKHTRSQEEAADQSALNFLDKEKISSKGLVELLEVLYGKEVAMYNDINPYTLTHPLSRERIDHVRSHYVKSQFSENILNGNIAVIYARAITKLDAFLEPTKKTLKQFPTSDTSINGRYARAIGYYKIPDLEKSLKEIDSLIKEFPQDPFFIELKGQILFENGKINEAIIYYTKAKELLPNASLFQIELATAQIATEDKSHLKSAITNLEQALNTEKHNSFTWHQLGIAYGRLGILDMSNLALAEEAMLIGDEELSKQFIKTARKYTKDGSIADLRLKDLENAIKDQSN
jgi:predicted Zn-dependent protease